MEPGTRQTFYYFSDLLYNVFIVYIDTYWSKLYIVTILYGTYSQRWTKFSSGLYLVHF